ncbi:hypothetical protein ACVNPS_09075 [Candidatus Bipolaricaulota sp. J31]
MRSLAICFLFVLLATMAACNASEGIPPKLLQKLFSYIPPQAPIVYLRYISLGKILPEKEAVVLGTGLYRLETTHAAKLYVFVKENEWRLSYATDMDERLKAQGLFELGWEIRLKQIVLENLDQDKQKEIVIFWASEPIDNISAVQLQTIIHIIDYDAKLQQFREVTNDHLVYHWVYETALLLNVDCDYEKEIVLFRGDISGDYCILCGKPYDIEVWTLRNGKLMLDPSWNNGQTFRVKKILSLSGEEYSPINSLDCSLLELLQKLLCNPGEGLE